MKTKLLIAPKRL